MKAEGFWREVLALGFAGRGCVGVIAGQMEAGSFGASEAAQPCCADWHTAKDLSVVADGLGSSSKVNPLNLSSSTGSQVGHLVLFTGSPVESYRRPMGWEWISLLL